MIFHFSMDADQPERVAKALAWIWSCEAYPFPPVGKGSWIVIADDGRASAIEIYQRGVVLAPGAGAEPVQARSCPAPANSATHFAVATQLGETEVCALGAAEGWRCVRQSRGGRFDVIELWIENRILIEVLTPEMQAQYLATSNPAEWRQMMEARRAA
jgi:hypothetical protein